MKASQALVIGILSATLGFAYNSVGSGTANASVGSSQASNAFSTHNEVAAPIDLKMVNVGNQPPFVTLSWSTTDRRPRFRIYRDSVKVVETVLRTTIDRKVQPGRTYTYTVSELGKTGEGPKSASLQVTVPALPTSPAVPSSVSATGIWAVNCPTCKMSMAHVVLNWSSVASASTYKVLRDGSNIANVNNGTKFIDMTVTSGKLYKYAVVASNTIGDSAPSQSASVIPPTAPVDAPVGDHLIPPTNIETFGIFANGRNTDQIQWDSVPGAASYNVYQYGQKIASNVKDSTFTIPVGYWYSGMTYTVSSVDAGGMESIPSGLGQAFGATDPTNLPNWVSNYVPGVRFGVPIKTTVTPEWNNGGPRNFVSWAGQIDADAYNVYRDGVKVASNISALYYYDNHVTAGTTYSYTVSGINIYWPGGVEGGQSRPASGTALAKAPAVSTVPFSVSKVQGNDDSCIIYFNAVPGAVDYKVCPAAPLSDTWCKYSGGKLSVEINGIDPNAMPSVQVEAIDKLGPFKVMDGDLGTGSVMSDMSSMELNGQGDPSNVPNVLATTAPVKLAVTQRSLSGAQVFFDNFRNDTPFVQSPTMDQSIIDRINDGPNNATNRTVREYSNNNWVIRDYRGDMINTKFFLMNNHFMDTLYDGGTPHTGVGPHNNNASLVMMPKSTADISGGKVLHVTFEVDAHMDGRRWLDLFIGEAGDPLVNPGKFAELGDFPTIKGNMFRWEIQQAHGIQMFLNGKGNDLIQATDWADGYTLARMAWDKKPLCNGTTKDIDLRHKFDLYLSKTHYRIVESSPDGSNPVVREKEFPSGVALPFDKIQVYFVHQVYHTGNDRPELIQWAPEEKYWPNFRPWADERHWDNMGFEVLDAFPTK